MECFQGIWKMLSEREIFKRARGLESLSGIYFLIRDNKIIYIGESDNVYKRIWNHLSNKKHYSGKKIEGGFDYYSVDIMPNTTTKEKRRMEAMYIMIYEPEYNTIHNCGEINKETIMCFNREVKQKFIDGLRECE